MKKYYTFLLCMIVLNITVTAQTLVASYPFNGNANDASGNGNNGTVNGATLTTDRFGNANSAYSFNGTSNFIQIPNSSSLQLGSSFTISAWVNHNGFYNGNYQGNFYVSKGNDDNQTPGDVDLASGETDGNINPDPTGYKIFYFNNTLAPGTYAQVLSDSPAVKLHQWYYIVATASGNTLKFYVDGKLMATNISTGTVNGNNGDDLFLGRQNKTGFEYWFNGIMDEVKIYKDTLSAAQIFDTYVNDVKIPGSGNALQFDGSTNYVESPRSDSFAFGTSFSANAWIKTTDFEGDIVCNFEEASPFQGFLFGIGFGSVGNNTDPRAGKLGFYVANSSVGGSYNDLAGNRVDDGNWHNVAVTYNGSNVIFYIDGVLSSTVSASNIPIGNSKNVLRIGRDNNNPGLRYLNGQVDELQLWNITLTQTKIRDWMCKKVTSSHPSFPNLVAYYRFDEGYGTISSSVGGHSGTLINSPTWLSSGASLGDASAYDYTNATKTANLTAATGEKFTVTNTSGAPAGLQVYRVDTIPNTTNGANSGNNNKYFGVFQVGGTTPTYTAVYNYTGNPLVIASTENMLGLFKRHDNSVTSWTDCGAALNTTNKTLTTTGQSTEYILGVSSGTLPVSLINFAAYKQNATVKLSWQSQNEINFSKFDIERSKDGLSFTSIGSMNALHGSLTNSYSLVDNTPASGYNFYRLKQVNADGQFTYSKIISVDFSKKLIVRITPNPARDVISITTSDVIKEVRLISLNGKLMSSWFNISGTTNLNISNLAAGVYILKMITADEKQSQKIVKE